MSEESVVDIRAKAAGPAGTLSNFAAHDFSLDGVACASMEGFLQGLKIADPVEQKRVCGLVGEAAKKAGQRHDWRARGALWWGGREIDRFGVEYQALLDRAWRALAEKSWKFRAALAATEGARLVHTMGKSDPRETVLTEAELCDRLTALRAALRSSARG